MGINGPSNPRIGSPLPLTITVGSGLVPLSTGVISRTRTILRSQYDRSSVPLPTIRPFVIPDSVFVGTLGHPYPLLIRRSFQKGGKDDKSSKD